VVAPSAPWASNAREDTAIAALVDRFAALIAKVSGKEPVL